MRCALASTLVVASLAVAGCAQGGTQETDSATKFSGVEKQVATTVEDLQTAAKDKNGAKICASLITIEYQQAIAKQAGTKGCSSAVDAAIKQTDPVDYVVKDIQVSGDTATATVQSKSDKDVVATETWKLRKQAGRWKVSSSPPSS